MDDREKADKMKEWQEITAQIQEISFERMPAVLQDCAKEIGMGHQSPTKSEKLYQELQREKDKLFARGNELKKEFEKAKK